jgi:hypothetical protein
VVLLCDPRLGLTELDEALLAMRPRVEQGLKFLVLLTKADKLTRAEQAKACPSPSSMPAVARCACSRPSKAGRGRCGPAAVALVPPRRPGARHTGPRSRRPGGGRRQPAQYRIDAPYFGEYGANSGGAMIETIRHPCPRHHAGLPRQRRPGSPCCCFCTAFPKAPSSGMAADNFADRWRCVAPNLRGYGRSSQPPMWRPTCPKPWCRTWPR